MITEEHSSQKIKVGINGYGVIGRRVADAVLRQTDMQLLGVSDTSADLRVQMALGQGISLYASSETAYQEMKKVGFSVSGQISELLKQIDVIVDCTPKRQGAASVSLYRDYRVKFILQGGEKHETTGHSFVAESTYEQAIGRESTRVVSC